MYKYDDIDKQILTERVSQFRNQIARFISGDLTETEFKPLRLQNGLYQQRLAPMLRICVPYGMLNSTQVRTLARITRDYDKGYAHISTRQNVQINWLKLEEAPDILAELADVNMHAIQTSGNSIRNITTDQFAGVASDETEDPRPWCEIIRQWSTLHPEFTFLPRKFKIAVCGSESDRAVIHMHDIGLELVKDSNNDTGFKVMVGGGQGRTPVIGSVVREFLPQQHLLTYLDAILRIYNQYGRRDNIYKARIKILVRAMGVASFTEKVELEWQRLKDGPATLTDKEMTRVKACFTEPDYKIIDVLTSNSNLQAQVNANKDFANWVKRNVLAHKRAGYAIVNLSLKRTGIAPGDVTDKQLEVIADLADKYSFGEIRNTHDQNIVMADVAKTDLLPLWEQARAAGLATPNIGYLTDMICCPGGDFCALANAKSIPVAEAIQRKFADLDYIYDLGKIDLNISGCMNACGHHHVGHIGILGVDKKGREFYQISIGGSAGKDASIAKILGPSFNANVVPKVLETMLNVYVETRSHHDEQFIDTYRRVGIEPFKEAVYA